MASLKPSLPLFLELFGTITTTISSQDELPISTPLSLEPGLIAQNIIIQQAKIIGSALNLNYTPWKCIILYTNASWIDPSGDSSIGFVAITNARPILIASYLGTMTDSPILAKITTMNQALKVCYSRSYIPDKIHCDFASIAQMLRSFDNCVAWRFK